MCHVVEMTKIEKINCAYYIFFKVVMLMLRVWMYVKCVVLVLSALQEQSILHLVLKGTTAS